MQNSVVNNSIFSKKQWVVIVSLFSLTTLAGLISLLYIIFSQDKTLEAQFTGRLKQQVDSLIAPIEEENLKLKRQIQVMDGEVEFFKKRVSYVDSVSFVRSEESRNYFININKKLNAKLTTIDKYTPDDIDSVITKRYGKN